MKVKQYVRFVGYNKNSKIPTMSLNSQNNKYCCSRCGAGGFSVGLYAKVRGIDKKKAYKELIDREYFSQDKVSLEISPINILSDIEIMDRVYRDFLSMLKLEGQHKMYLKNIGFLESTIEDNLYRSVPKNYIKRRLICNSLSKKYNLARYSWFFSRRRLELVF